MSLLISPSLAWTQTATPTAAQCGKGQNAADLVASCRGAVSRDPSDAKSRDRLAAGLAQQGKYAEALREWEIVVRASPNEFTAHHNAGLMLEILERFDAALPMFQRALQLTTDQTALQTTHWHIGVAQSHLGKLDESLLSFREAARLDSLDASAWSYAGIVAARLNRHAEAVSFWERTLLVDPRYFEKAQAGEGRLYRTSLAIAGPQQPAPVDTGRGTPPSQKP